MANDFEQIGHKNLELLRFYVSKDIKKIDSKLQKNESELMGYFLGSLVDILVVFLFNDIFSTFILLNINITFWQVALKILCIVLLIGVFLFVSWSSKKIHEYRVKKSNVSGKSAYVVDDKRQEMIDDFDNIACDGLLICQNYISRYNEVKDDKEEYIKEFYLYEIIHHLSKATSIFNVIYCNQNLYISAKNIQLLDSYRVNNFIFFSQQIMKFLVEEIKHYPNNQELKDDMINLENLVNGWTSI